MRIAAIDIGTNSIHMIVVQVRPDLSFEVIDREKDMVRLGAGGLDGRSLTPTAMGAALQTMSKFKRIADSHKVDEIVAAATSATREAENGGDFIAEVDRQTGIRIKVISGTEEARLIHLAAGYGVDIGGTTAVVVDIGGGSVEITLGTATHLTLGRSFKVGVIRLTEHFVKSDPLSGGDERRLIKHLNKEMGSYIDQIVARGFDRVIGTSGTILSLGVMASTADGKPPEDLRNRRVGAKALHKLRKHLVESDIEERLATPGMDPRRADLSVAGSVLFDTIVRRLGADSFTLCDLALREGLVLDYIHRNSARIRKVERYPDVRRRSIIELGERCGYWSEHAQQVARLALNIFDQTRSVHGLSDREREWLEYGALLHDIGVHISYERHHRHSYYLIKNGDLRGFDPDEIEVIALIARYHRQATPKKSHEGYGDLRGSLRKTVKTLSAMVRLAEGLDRSHAQALEGIDLYPRGDDYLARLRAAGDAELEVWAAHRHVAPLEALLGKPIRFEVAGADYKDRGTADGGRTTHSAHAEQPDDAPRVPGKAVRRRRNRRIGKDDAAVPPGEVA
ncbi:MAG TPA: Ppx/GppA phosphatase family protein [Vicinamibacterales bacterium]|nr:Ppx/GppA phosphatase family protein [Vicinamibacterales bacterium]